MASALAKLPRLARVILARLMRHAPTDEQAQHKADAENAQREVPGFCAYNAPRFAALRRLFPWSSPKLLLRLRRRSGLRSRPGLNERKPSPHSLSDAELKIDSYTVGPNAHRL